MRELEAIARHLMGAAYGGAQQLVGAAIVEEPLEGATTWWLVLTRACETKAAHVEQWLRKRLPPECHLDVEQSCSNLYRECGSLEESEERPGSLDGLASDLGSRANVEST